jgi:hypothetical protein
VPNYAFAEGRDSLARSRANDVVQAVHELLGNRGMDWSGVSCLDRLAPAVLLIP